MKQGCEGFCALLTPHGVLTILFFLCIAYVCVFRASDTLGLMKDSACERRYRRTYRLLGILMVLSPLPAAILAHLLQASSSIIFFAEASGVWVFAFYWIVKGCELRKTDADTQGTERRLVARAYSLRDLFRTIRVEAGKDVASQTTAGQG
jgi:hypothetical protein